MLSSLLRPLAPLLLLAFAAHAAQPFPALETTNLFGQRVLLPDAAKGRRVLLLIAFTRTAQTQIKTWSTHLESDVKPFSIAVLASVPRFLRPVLISSMKSGVPIDQRSRYLILTTHQKALRTAAAFDRPNDAYLVLLDRSGNIRWHAHGPPTDRARAELKSQLLALY